MPAMGQLVREKGQTSVGNSYSSSVAKTILNKFNNTTDNSKQFNMILVYYNENKLTNENKNIIQNKITELSDNKSKYQVILVSSVFQNADLADEYISEDGTTLLVPITLSKEYDTISNIQTNIIRDMKIDGLELQCTGSDLITEDFARTTEKGVQKTEMITIVFIVIVLLIIFRSPVTPLINLAAVGLTFMVSLNIVLQLVNYFGFPISNFSRVFLILILFGIGTDYTMLLLMRFKEELEGGADRNTAIRNTYKTAGKTVLFSSLTIFIGFTCLFFVQFNLFKSASAVAIGVAVLILVLYTFIPAIMMLLGKHLFWSPFKTKGHGESRVWESVSRFSIRFPYITFILCGLICFTVLLYNGNLSYNNMSEVEPSYSSVVGYNIITEHFGSGKTAPVTIAFESDQTMDNQSDIEQVDRLTEVIKSIDGVDTVYSVTQPKGGKIDELYLDSQIKTAADGLVSAQAGIDKIKDGLQSAVTQIQSTAGNAASLDQLQSGTNDLISGISSLKSASGQVSTGLESLEKGAETLSHNLGQLKTSYCLDVYHT
jgi:RND superfamily putative drug exporter